MTNHIHISREERRGNRFGKLILLTAILVAGSLTAWWLADRCDRQMRADLLARTRLVAEALNIDRIKPLAGTEADLTSPAYLQLKEQLAAVRTAEAKCRFVYLMGRRPDGKVFFRSEEHTSELQSLA